MKLMNYYMNRLRPVASFYRNNLTSVFVDVNQEKMDGEMKELGVEKAEVPVLVLHDLKNRKKFHFDGALKVAEIKEFVEQFFQNSLPPYVKSQKNQPENDGDVRIVVGKNFEAVVRDPTKDTLIEFYATWCGYAFPPIL